MKNIVKIILTVMTGSLLFISCSKDSNGPMPEMKKAVVPLITKAEGKDAIIYTDKLAAFKGGVVVDIFFKDKPKSMDLWVEYNGGDSAIVQGNITTFPTTVNFDLAKLVEVLPNLNNINQIVSGDAFTFYVNMTLDDGTIVNNRDTLYAAITPDIYGENGASLEITYDVVCPLVLSDFVGQYDMFDGYPEDNCVVTIALDPNDENGLIINDFYAGTGVTGIHPVKVTVNPADYTCDLGTQVIADDLWGYGTGTLSNATGTVNACVNSLEFSGELSVSIGSFGIVNFSLTKK